MPQIVPNKAGGFLTRKVYNGLLCDPRTMSITTQLKDNICEIISRADILPAIENLNNYTGKSDDILDKKVFHYYVRLITT